LQDNQASSTYLQVCIALQANSWKALHEEAMHCLLNYVADLVLQQIKPA
jgi:hypothetical protein